MPTEILVFIAIYSVFATMIVAFVLDKVKEGGV